MADFEPTEEQQRILDHVLGSHARILAGPGTGKSATVVALLTRLLQTENPPRVRLLTFTRAATGELAAKVLEHPALAALRPSTVHSFSIAVLLANPDASDLPMPLRIADDWEDKEIVRRSLGRRLGLPLSKINWLFRELAAGWESLTPHRDERVEDEERARFTGGWTEHRRVLGYTLLSELPFALRAALQEHDDLGGIDVDLLIVDEYQDLNACDLALFREIARRGAFVCAAGDDDQSIYSMRKAAPEGIRRFVTEYDPVEDYALSIAQRFGSRILNWATFVIEGDPDRPRRPRLTPAAHCPPGEIALLCFPSHAAEAAGIAQIADRLVNEERIPPGEILILLRGDHNGNFSRPIKAELDGLGVPYSDPDAVKRFLGEERNRKCLEAFKILINPYDSLAWAALLRLEPGIGDGFFDYVYHVARSNRQGFGATLRRVPTDGFSDAPRNTATLASRLINVVEEWRASVDVSESTPEGGWGNWIIDVSTRTALVDPTPELAELLTDVDQGTADQDQSLERYISLISPMAKDLALAKSDGIRIMTLSGAKGLTVRATIIGAVEEGIIPRPDADLAEERRLLYVGMTRAREILYCTWARRRTGPTARSGTPRVAQRRMVTPFLRDGPEGSQDGHAYLRERWP